jgi:hypothetical protein
MRRRLDDESALALAAQRARVFTGELGRRSCAPLAAWVCRSRSPLPPNPNWPCTGWIGLATGMLGWSLCDGRDRCRLWHSQLPTRLGRARTEVRLTAVRSPPTWAYACRLRCARPAQAAAPGRTPRCPGSHGYPTRGSVADGGVAGRQPRAFAQTVPGAAGPCGDGLCTPPCNPWAQVDGTRGVVARRASVPRRGRRAQGVLQFLARRHPVVSPGGMSPRALADGTGL